MVSSHYIRVRVKIKNQFQSIGSVMMLSKSNKGQKQLRASATKIKNNLVIGKTG